MANFRDQYVWKETIFALKRADELQKQVLRHNDQRRLVESLDEQQLRTLGAMLSDGNLLDGELYALTLIELKPTLTSMRSAKSAREIP